MTPRERKYHKKKRLRKRIFKYATGHAKYSDLLAPAEEVAFVPVDFSKFLEKYGDKSWMEAEREVFGRRIK